MQAEPQARGPTLMLDGLEKVCIFYLGQGPTQLAFCGKNTRRVYTKRTNPHCHLYVTVTFELILP